jgi:hypothetical protein
MTLTPSLAAVSGPQTNARAGAWTVALDWCAHAARFVVWGLIGLLSAFASYFFGVAALVLGLLSYVRMENEWWPAALCLLFGYLSARVSIACMDSALASGPSSNGGFREEAPAVRL